MSTETELSEREVEILRLLATGASNKEIAQMLVISPNTVKVHLRNIFEKLGVVSRTEATLTAMRMGLVESVGVPRAEAMEGESQSGLLTTLPESTAQLQALPKPNALKRWLGWVAVLVFVTAGVLAIILLASPPQQAQSTPAPSIIAPTLVAAAPRWQVNLSLPEGRSAMAGATFESALYLFGGTGAEGASGATLRFTPSAARWETLAAKPTPVSDAQAAVLGEKIYIPGGRSTNGQPINVLEAFSPRQNKWEQLAPLPVALSGYALAAFDGDLYLLGGWNGKQYTANVFSYDPDSNTWQAHRDMPVALGLAAAVTQENRIYLIGGTDGQTALSSVRVYFPSRERAGSDPAWEDRAPMPEGRYGMGAVSLASMIYVVGGESDTKPENGLAPLQFMPYQNRWERFERAPAITGSKVTLLALDTRLHVIGGQTAEGLSASHLTYQAIYTISLPSVSNP